jgi:hypothetical protein
LSTIEGVYSIATVEEQDMSQVLDEFNAWVRQLTPTQKAELVRYLADNTREIVVDGIYAGPAPGSRANSCPKCGHPL